MSEHVDIDTETGARLRVHPAPDHFDYGGVIIYLTMQGMNDPRRAEVVLDPEAMVKLRDELTKHIKVEETERVPLSEEDIQRGDLLDGGWCAPSETLYDLFEYVEDEDEVRDLAFTDEEWVAYQRLPEQGISHRHWLEHVFRRKVAARDKALRDERTVAREELAAVLWRVIDDKGIRGRLYREDCDYLADALLASPALAQVFRERETAALREVAVWVAEHMGYPVEMSMPAHPAPQKFWDVLVDHIHTDATGKWHGNGLSRDEVASWLDDEAGRYPEGETR